MGELSNCFEDAVEFPCGLVVKNRLVKASLAEDLCSSSGVPGDDMFYLYSTWSEGEWGMLLSGHVMVDETYRAGTKDPIIKQQDLDKWQYYAKSCTANGTVGILQLNHPGRQCPRGCKSAWSNLAPSPMPLDLGGTIAATLWAKYMFGTPREMTRQDIGEVVKKFVEAAVVTEQAGFHGVEIHAAHGYLLSSFLSEKSNARSDNFGGSAENRVRIVQLIISGIRSVVKPSFAVGIKVNTADAPNEMAETICQLKLLAEDGGLDFIELSGGSYENPLMFQSRDKLIKQERIQMKESTKNREAYFAAFSKELRAQIPQNIKILLTGGFRSRKAMRHAIETENICDFIGIGRPACIDPHFPKDIIWNKSVEDKDAYLLLDPIPPPTILSHIIPAEVAGHGQSVMHYASNLQKISRGAPIADNRL